MSKENLYAKMKKFKAQIIPHQLAVKIRSTPESDWDMEDQSKLTAV